MPHRRFSELPTRIDVALSTASRSLAESRRGKRSDHSQYGSASSDRVGTLEVPGGVPRAGFKSVPLRRPVRRKPLVQATIRAMSTTAARLCAAEQAGRCAIARPAGARR